MFVGHFCPPWIRIVNPDPDMNPDPQQCSSADWNHSAFTSFSISIISNLKLYLKWVNGVLPYRLLSKITNDLFMTGWNGMNYVYRSSSLYSRVCLVTHSVADPGCLFRIPDPDFYPFLIPDPTKPKKGEEEKITCVGLTFFVGANLTKLKIILCLNVSRKNLIQLTKIYSTFYRKNGH